MQDLAARMLVQSVAGLVLATGLARPDGTPRVIKVGAVIDARSVIIEGMAIDGMKVIGGKDDAAEAEVGAEIVMATKSGGGGTRAAQGVIVYRYQ